MLRTRITGTKASTGSGRIVRINQVVDTAKSRGGMAEHTPLDFVGLSSSPDTPIVSMQQHPVGEQSSKLSFTLKISHRIFNYSCR